MPSKKKITWSSQAEQDFAKILDYLHFRWNNKVVNHFIDITSQTMDRIQLNPTQFQSVFKKEKIRKSILTKQNTLYFKENKNEIIIIRIFDTRQNPFKLKLT